MNTRFKPHYIAFTVIVIALFYFLNTEKLMGQAGNMIANQSDKTKLTIDLDGNWMMKDYSIGIGYQDKVYQPGLEPKDALPCMVPGTVRTALLQAKEIPDPYYGYDNEKSMWVEQKEWWFFKKFNVDKALDGKFIELAFEGTSFQGDCWLNGQRVGELKGMLNPRSFDVTKLLKYGEENSLVVCLTAPPDAKENSVKDGLTWWTNSRDQLYSIAQCMYGWDWGPHCFGIGIWQPVKLKITGPVRLSKPYIQSKLPTDNKSDCKVEVDIQNLTDQSLDARVAGIITAKNSKDKAGEHSEIIKLAAGETKTLRFNVEVKNPKLWWPNGMGEQNLYNLQLKIYSNNLISDSIASQFGIRELKLVANENIASTSATNKPNSVYYLGLGEGSYPWTFLVNGKKMFAKGGNWIPVDQLLRLDKDRYDWLLRLFKQANFNLLRIWGGGLYETDDFYNLCDEYGILGWQEFLSNKNFSKIDRVNFLEGAESAIIRIRNHPSLTFWCGGNEFNPDDKGSKAVIDDLGELIKKLDPQRDFHRASPYMGDDHYWGVWHGQEPYTSYRVVHPFRSEAGINSLPVPENYIKFAPPQKLWPLDTEFIEYHGEYNLNFQHVRKLSRYANEFGESANYNEFITRNQFYQAIGNEFNMEFCRSNKFRNSGMLVWQYDDIWPCISWSIVDWYGTPKPSYYFLKRAARPVHISADFEKYLINAGETFKADVYLLNDKQEAVKGLAYTARLLNAAGKTLSEKKGKGEAGINSSAKIGDIGLLIPETMKGKTLFLTVELKDKSGIKISDGIYPVAVAEEGNTKSFNNIFKEINEMPKVPLKIELLQNDIKIDKSGTANGSIRISNPSGNLAFYIRINNTDESDILRTSYSDNYISLLPGESKTVSINIERKGINSLPGEIRFEVSGWNCPPATFKFKTTNN